MQNPKTINEITSWMKFQEGINKDVTKLLTSLNAQIQDLQAEVKRLEDLHPYEYKTISDSF